jgi:aryl-alcohol dehydrogenase-like predicted oxidoreductase
MTKRMLGKGGFEVGEVGIGCWQFGGDFGPMEEATAFAILEAAVESGTNFFDTADVYGSGRSEELIGRFLKTCEKSITVATKVGRGDDLYPNLYNRETMRNSVLRSMKRLNVEALDLVQLHCIPTAVLRDGEVFDWLRGFQSEGLIKRFGASVESVEEGLICLQQEGLLSLQVIFNPFRMKLADELLPQASARGVGIIVRLPLASGLLSGKFTQATSFPASDHRNFNADGQFFNVGETFAGLPFQKGVELADSLKEFVPAGMTLAQITLRWILDHEAVSVIIPGASSPAQAVGNAKCSQLEKLPAELHERLRSFYRSQVAAHIRGPY